MFGRYVVVDTNVLVHAYDRRDPQKQERALGLMRYLTEHGAGIISTQILSEFFVNVVRKLGMQPAEAYQRVQNYLQSWTVVSVTGAIALEAARGVRDYQFSYWDSQLWATAHLNQIPVVLSEDFNPGAVIEGVRFENPFEPAFQITEFVP